MTDIAKRPVCFLLVDDLEENLLALEALLRRDDLVLLKARSGREALELLLAHDVALALVDVQMPEMDGFELAELMRGMERTRRVPLIFLTAGAADRRRGFRGYEAGAVDFLHKPIEADILRSKADVFFELYRQREEVNRLLDESRQYAQALRDADRRKDEFLATLAHELRNPLAPLRNGLQLLRFNGVDSPAAGETLGIMERQLGQLVRLVDDLLDVSRITLDKLELRTERVPLSSVVAAAVETSRPLIESLGHKLNVDIPSEPVFLDADTMRLAQVFSNLLNNGAKYTPRNGRIELTARREGDQVEIAVRDNGVGIRPESLSAIFEMFTQGELSAEQGGLGIGLTLVRRLVQLHHGTVEARSAGVGRGSEFVVRLPTTPQAVPSARPVPKTESKKVAAGKRVLVVDDNRDAAVTLGRMLKMLGHETQSVHDGLDAVAAAERFRPQLIILDIGLPSIDGYEVCRRIRQQPWGRGIILAALTGWGQEEDYRRSQDAGFDRHLVKPIELTALEQLLSTDDRPL